MNIVVLQRGQAVQHKSKWSGTVQSFGDGWVRVKRWDTGKVHTVLPHKLRAA